LSAAAEYFAINMYIAMIGSLFLIGVLIVRDRSLLRMAQTGRHPPAALRARTFRVRPRPDKSQISRRPRAGVSVHGRRAALEDSSGCNRWYFFKSARS